MNDPFIPRIGAVLSADVALPDHARMRDFYARVLGTGERPRWRPDLLNDLGWPVLGVGPRVEAHAHLPTQWMPHLQVGDVAVGVETALAHGGRELLHARDDDGHSQWAVLLDPNGAAFGIIPVPPAPPAAADPAELAARARAGRIVWLDLTVADAASTRSFYERVIGWSSEGVSMTDGTDTYVDHAMLAEDGEAVAGICHARGPNRGLPPVWLLYLPVGDLDQSVERVQALGGQIIKDGRGDGSTGAVVIRDPAGAHVALVQG